MPFGLRNDRETYQCLVDQVFHRQIGRNLEVYVDDLVIKSHTEDEIIRDIKETFKTLREINMKLNQKKMYLRGRRRDVPGIQGQYQRNKAESALKQMKQLIAKLTMLTAPEEKEELIVYLATSKEAGQILADFIVKRSEEDSPDTPMEVEEELPEQ
ncbi:hypothetical protein Tco_0745052 [Tanacetum coccineum]